ncbi:3-phosphoshikimate 1-carboxyvinyltransferase [Thioalkalivibrio sp. HK1]|uniref:3-phosphoshikimate 1-carboxyvinyltransferase n=1 Tax=Thioalkalivibrio sp. HK1 TaxID=1469245 RepID=UPI00046FF833|nr:3-phosphoshikimate 1-carboxyvinyltransferase [Thioalkalivibrio sp. HK1]
MTTTAPIDYLVRPTGALCGDIRVPGDKSISHRSLMLAAIAEGRTRIRNLLRGEDVLATMAALRSMGVRIDDRDPQPSKGERGRDDIDEIVVHGIGDRSLSPPRSGVLDLGNSGTSMRLLAGLLCARIDRPCSLTGDPSLSRRPMRRITDPLSSMGAKIEPSPSGTPPIRLEPIAGDPFQARLRAIDFSGDVVSAQVKSAILLAGLRARGTTCYTEPGPSRDHTERMLAAFGAPPSQEGLRTCIEGGIGLRGTVIDVPGDLSSAAFFLAAAAGRPGSDIIVRGVGINPTRSGVLSILEGMGARIERHDIRGSGGEPVADLRVRGTRLQGIDIDPASVPLAIDEFPAIFVAAAAARGCTRVRGAKELRIKESDRIAAVADALFALRIEVEVFDDGMAITGGEIAGGSVDSASDHRIAMAFATAGIGEGSLRIRDCRHVATSFPGFVALAGEVGLDIEVQGGDA